MSSGNRLLDDDAFFGGGQIPLPPRRPQETQPPSIMDDAAFFGQAARPAPEIAGAPPILQEAQPQPIQQPTPQQPSRTRLQDVVPESVRQADTAAGAWIDRNLPNHTVDAQQQIAQRIRRIAELDELAKNPNARVSQSAIASARATQLAEIRQIGRGHFPSNEGEPATVIDQIADLIERGADPSIIAANIDRSGIVDPGGRTPLGWIEALGRSIGAAGIGFPGSVAQGTGLIMRNLGAEETGQRVQQGGQIMLDKAEEIGPAEEYRGVATDVAGGFVSMGAFIGAGIPAAILTRTWGTIPRGIATMGTAGTLAAPTGASEAYQRAIAFGLPEEQAVEISLYGIPAGVVQVAPVGVILRAIPPSQRGSMLFQIRHVAEAAFSEFGAEGAGVVMQNFLEQSYNPQRGLWDDALYQAFIGAIVGGGTAAGLQAITRGRGVAPVPEQQDPLAIDPETGVPRGATPAEELLGQDPETARERQLQQAREALERDLLGRPAPQPSSPHLIGLEGLDAVRRALEPEISQPPPPQVAPQSLQDWLDDPRTAEEIRADIAAPVEPPAPTGQRSDPIAVETPQDVHAGAQITATPTPAQAEAGNYRKRHLTWQGLDIAIETEMGQERTGIGSDGTPWSVTMPAPYGYIKRTEGRDGDQVDIYLGPDPQAGRVFVVDQIDPATGKFDEHKVMLGFDESNAVPTYMDAFSDGSGLSRLGAITPMSVAQFKQWLRNGNTRKPVAYEPPKAPRKPAQRTPTSLFEFLASRGGIAPDPELTALDLDNAFVPGYGRLVRAGGMSLDRAREAAAEAGFVGFGAPDAMDRYTIRQFLELLDAEARRGKGATEQDGGAARQDRLDAIRVKDPAYIDHVRHQAKLTVDETLAAWNYKPSDFHPDFYERVIDLVAEGRPVEEAVTTAEFEILSRDPPAAKAVADAIDEPLPGFDDADFQSDEGGAGPLETGEQGAQPGAQEGAAPASAGVRAGGEAAGAQGGQFEPGAEGLPQSLIPGVAPVTDGERLTAQANRPMGPRRPQQEPGGLFGPERDQADIFDTAFDAGQSEADAAAAPQRDPRQPIGTNARGNPLYEDERGVRSYSERGVRITESVGIIPGGGISIDTSARGRDFLTAEEWAEENPQAGQAESTRETSRSDVGTPEHPNVQALGRAFGEHFASPDGSFKTILQARKFAADLLGGPVRPGTEAAKLVDEAIEFGVVLAGREIVAASRAQNRSDKMIFDRLADLYERQPSLNVRTSTSVANQAYSTPLPLAFVASRLAGITPQTEVLEPTAGNGALLIEADPGKATANELEATRRDNLDAQGFHVTSGLDAADPESYRKPSMQGPFDVVIQNPPFGVVKEGGRSKRFKIFDRYETNEIDHAIVMRSLEQMADDGSAVLIIGGVNKLATGDARAEAYNGKAKREFYFNLYSRYNVVEHVTVSGDLYAKQGAAWPVDVIVIRGKGKSQRRLPAADVPRILSSWADVKGLLDAQYTGRAQAADGQAGGTARADDAAGTRRDDARGDNDVRDGGARPERLDGRDPNGRADGVRDGSDRGERGAAAAPQSAAARVPSRDGSPQRPAAGADAGVDPFDAAFDAGQDEADAAATKIRITTPETEARNEWNRASEAQKAAAIRDAGLGELPTTIRWESLAEDRQARLIDALRHPRAAIRAAAASAAQNAAEGADAAISALVTLFNSKGRPGSGFTFDSDTYAQAKPLFQKAAQKFRAAWGDVGELVRLIVVDMRAQGLTREGMEALRPYLRRFMEDVQSGAITLEETSKAPTPTKSRAPKKPAAEPEAPTLFETESQADTAALQDGEPVKKPKPRKPDEKIDTSNAQVPYRPRSDARPMQTLVPVNMQTAVSESLAALEKRVGDIDAFVARELGMTQKELVESFGAEQVDGVALAIDNFARGAGFVVGDQTGIGKGRQVAAVLRWSIKNGKTPIFVTEKPNLYADMYRDLVDVGVPKMLGRDIRMLMTNAGESVPLTDEGDKVLKSQGTGPHNALLKRLVNTGKLEGYDIVFTTYSQMQTVKGEATVRMAFLEAMASANGVIVMDESHNAGGQQQSGFRGGESDGPALNRATFARGLIQKASAVLYSSATYAKRPDVMDLYAKTDMRLAVEDISKLGDLIARGGIPMQQIVATMLARAGQYARRERSFDGIRYETPVIPVNRQSYERFSGSIKLIQDFSEKHVKDAIKAIATAIREEAAAISPDGSTGGAGATSTNFTSIMHNVINQMLLSITSDQAAERAIAALKAGEKPVITVASTLESFLAEYAEENGLKPGDAVSLSVKDLLLRYLERSRRYTVKPPGAKKGESIQKYLTDSQLGPAGVRAFKRAKAAIESSGLDDMPISPIDWIRQRITAAGYSVSEITGRGMIVDYGADGSQRLSQRPDKERSIRGRRKAIADFNSGALDVLILNQAGSTGLSLHASEKVKDQRPRLMIIAQAEGNIDTHMQMLGRVNRTGQVVLPRYEQLVADVPATKRPAAVLAKKMASLNANTTGARSSAVTAKDVPDFMNVYGDQVAAAVMTDNPDLHTALGEPLPFKDGAADKDEAMRKVTGRIPLLPLAQQEALYEMLESEYAALIEQMEATGQNALEAKTLDLDAETLSTVEARPAGPQDSPFSEGVYFETVDVKRIGKPMSSQEVLARLREDLGLGEGASLAEIRRNGRERQVEAQRQARQEWGAYVREVLDDIESGDKRKAQETRLDGIMARWRDTIDKTAPGAGVKLMTSEGNYYGVVLGVKRTGSTKNPLALGAWKVTIALADSARMITLPFSQLYSQSTKPTQIPDSWVEIAPVDSIGSMPLLDAFDDMQAERREKRVMVTGNLLAGYEVTNAKGAIVNFTDREGRLRQGILMKRGFDAEKFLQTTPVRFNLGDHVVQFLERTKAAVTSADGLVMARVEARYGDIEISTDAGRGKGGRYYLDKGVLAAAGQDFVKKGGRMSVTAPGPRAARILDALREAGAVFETREHRDTAKKITGDDAALMRRREGAGASEVISRGDTTVQFVMRPQFVERLDRLEGELRARLDALGLSDVGVRLVQKIRFLVDGQGFAADGAYMSRLISVALDTAQDPNAVLDHEALHALKRLGFFTDAEWSVLERKSAGGWTARYNIDTAYADVSPEVRIEEGVAHAFSDWRAGKLNASGVVAKLFRRIANFIERLGNAMNGLGFISAEDVFGDIAAGVVGARNPRAMRATKADPAFARRPQTAQQRQALAQNFITRGQPIDRVIRLPFDVFGGLDRTGAWNPGKRMFDGAAKILTESKIDPNGRFGWLSGPIEAARAGLVDRYGLDKAYVERERRRGLDERKILAEGAEILEALKAVQVGTPEAKVLQAVLTGEEVGDADMQKIAEPIRVAIDRLGQEAVALGLVSPESYERNRATYLHRVYMKDEEGMNALDRFVTRAMRSRRKKIIGDQFKGRGIFVEVDAPRLVRDDPEWSEGKRGKPQKGEKFLLLEYTPGSHVDAVSGQEREARATRRVYWPADRAVPAKYRGVGWRNRGAWEIRGQKGGKLVLWRDYTKAERTKMGEIIDARYTIGRTFMVMSHDLATGRFYKDIAENEAWTSTMEPSAPWKESGQYNRYWNDPEIQWVRVSSDVIAKSGGKKRWGALAGKWVRAEIWRDLNEIDIMSRPSTWRRLLTQWKLNKALALDTPIPTPAGWTTMGEIREGDSVFDENGQPCTVLEVKDIVEGRPCYEVLFSDGSRIVSDEEHWWFTNHRNRGGGVRTTKEIRDSLTINHRGEAAHSIPVVKPLELPDADLPLPPYLLGAWLGDGDAAAPRISIGRAEAQEMRGLLEDAGATCTEGGIDKRTGVHTVTLRLPVDLRENGVRAALVSLGVLGAKAVPPLYLRGSIAQRMALLHGLMDTDGWITERGTCGYGTSTPALRDGVMELLRTLGFKPTVSESVSDSGKPTWRIHFQAFADRPVFRLAKKRERLRPAPDRITRSANRQIVAINPVASVPVRCIAVSSPSHLYLAGEAMIPTHNTARSPVVHMNNIMSNLMFMDMANIRFQDLAAGINAWVRKDANYREALENGAFGADMMSQELRDNVLRPILQDIRSEMLNNAPNAFVPRLRVLGRMAERIWEFARRADQKMVDAYRIEDELFRMATYMRRRELGDTAAEAAIFARDQFLDYDIRAPWVNALRNTVLPFISYTYRAVPLIARSIAYHPWKLPKYFIIAYMANALAYMWDDDEEAEGEERERLAQREDQQGYTWTGVPRMIRMPWRDENGLPVFLDIRRWIPAGDVFDLNQGQSAVPIPAPLQFGGPLMLGAELALNKQAFTGREITNQLTDDWWDTTRNVADWAWKSWMPSAAWVPNSWYWTRIENAVTGATDARGQPYSVPQSLASSVGIKLQPVDVQEGLAWREFRFRQVERELRRQANALTRQRERGLISEAAFNREMMRLMRKVENLSEQAQVPPRPTRER